MGMVMREGMKGAYSTHDVARICHVTPMTVIRWIEDGKLPAFKTVGGHRRIRGADLQSFCTSRGIPMPRTATGGVLLVDTDAARRASTASAIRSAIPGVEVHEAIDAHEAEQKRRSAHPAVIVVESGMTRGELVDTLRSLLDDPDRPS
jgi:excisionase family DNA binding protein